jgi:hypothetical protein
MLLLLETKSNFIITGLGGISSIFIIMWFMYTRQLVYAATFTTFYYNDGIFFYHKEGKQRMERK